MESSSLLPYEVTEESEWNYSFVTKDGIVYHAYFIDFSIYHSAFNEVYTFNIEPETITPHPIDNRIAQTVVYLLTSFFRAKERAMIMVCDNLDGKEEKRKALFSRWFLKYNDGRIIKYDAAVTTDDYQLYVSIYLNKNNFQQNELVAAFYDLVKNNLYPID